MYEQESRKLRYYPRYKITSHPDAPMYEHPDEEYFFSWRDVLDMLARLQACYGEHKYVSLDCNDQGHPCMTVGK